MKRSKKDKLSAASWFCGQSFHRARGELSPTRSVASPLEESREGSGVVTAERRGESNVDDAWVPTVEDVMQGPDAPDPYRYEGER